MEGIHDIYDPLDEYATVFRDKFKQIAQDTFEQLAREANIDVEANQQTCQALYKTQNNKLSLQNSILGYQVLCALMNIATIAGAIATAMFIDALSPDTLFLVVITIVVALLVAWIVIYPIIKQKKTELKEINIKEFGCSPSCKQSNGKCSSCNKNYQERDTICFSRKTSSNPCNYKNYNKCHLTHASRFTTHIWTSNY